MYFTKLFRLTSFILVLSLILSMGGGSSVLAQPQPTPEDPPNHIVNTDGIKPYIGTQGPVYVMLQLQADPAAVVYARQGKAVAKASIDTLKAAQASVVKEVTSAKFGATVLYQSQISYNGVAVKVDASKLPELAKIAGLKAIHRITLKSPDMMYSNKMIGADKVWGTAVNPNLGTGNGIRVGVIDSGIDYLHRDFDGPGTGYSTIDFTKPAPAYFPNVKVAGGWDFAGDDYNGYNTPQPDANPMDCTNLAVMNGTGGTVGHGTHVAGTVAGYGVVASTGLTYKGVYNDTILNDPEFWSIGPGVAPQAQLYALRVFGCTGSTWLVIPAIDWALDPNNDGDLSDHLDVINMSLGSDIGGGIDPDAVASENATLAGMVVVASAGNGGDSYYNVGSPSTGQGVISVAAVVDGLDVMSGLEVVASSNTGTLPLGKYGSSNAVAYNWASKPPVTGELLYPATNKGGCSAFPPGYFAGKIALLDWTYKTDGVTNECGSVTRTRNAVNAGAIGVVIAHTKSYLDFAITGSSVVPSTITTKATGDKIKNVLNASGTVRVYISADYDGKVKNIEPANNDIIASFSSRGPRSGDNFLKPDVSAPGVSIWSVAAATGNQGKSMGGTSMASPHVAGMMALLKQLHPTWSVQELKALAMNTANHSPWDYASDEPVGLSRAGAGRVDAEQAYASPAIVYNKDDLGAVSVSFGSPQVVTTTSLVKNVDLVNKGTTTVTYNVSYLDITDAPGVNYTIALAVAGSPALTPSDDIAVNGNSTVSLKVYASFDASLMANTFEETIQLTQGGVPRHWLTEESGYFVFQEKTDTYPDLRLPVYSNARAASNMATTGSFTLDVMGYGEADLAGTEVRIPSPDPINLPMSNAISMVAALELKGTSPANPTLSPDRKPGDLQYMGITTVTDSWWLWPAKTSKTRLHVKPQDSGEEDPLAYSMLYFGISTYADWQTNNKFEFDINIDIDKDGKADYFIANVSLGQLGLTNAAGDPDNTYYSLICPTNYGGNLGVCDFWQLNGLDAWDAWQTGENMSTGIFNSNVLLFMAPAKSIGLSGDTTSFNWWVSSFFLEDSSLVDTSPLMTYDAAKPAIETTNDYEDTDLEWYWLWGTPIYEDNPAKVIKVYADKDALEAQGGAQGLLLLHFLNGTTSTRAEVVPIEYHALTKAGMAYDSENRHPYFTFNLSNRTNTTKYYYLKCWAMYTAGSAGCQQTPVMVPPMSSVEIQVQVNGGVPEYQKDKFNYTVPPIRVYVEAYLDTDPEAEAVAAASSSYFAHFVPYLEKGVEP
ncbi:MAG TPA: S8 family serine peptidase [Anaerolineaceae bacterium]